MLQDSSKVTLPAAFAWRGFGSHPYLRLQQGMSDISPKEKDEKRCSRAASLLYCYANFASCTQQKSHQGAQPRSDYSLSFEHFSMSCDSVPILISMGMYTLLQSIIAAQNCFWLRCSDPLRYIDSMYLVSHFLWHTPPRSCITAAGQLNCNQSRESL